MKTDTSITSNDGYLLQFSSDEWCTLLTSQAIPKSMKSYSWEVKINKCSANTDIGSGFFTDSDSIRYWSDSGNIEDGKEIVETTESSQVNDTLSFHMRRVYYAGVTLQQ